MNKETVRTARRRMGASGDNTPPAASRLQDEEEISCRRRLELDPASSGV